jgi:hypothetical protein
MELPDPRTRSTRLLVASVLVATAVGALRKGKRSIGALAGVAAITLGYDASAEPQRTANPDDGEAETADDGRMRCASCGEPIVVGQSRRPNPDNEIVHEACMDALAERR